MKSEAGGDKVAAADNAYKLFEWLQKRKFSVPDGVDCMVMAIAICIKTGARDLEDAEEDLDIVCSMIKESLHDLYKMKLPQ